METIQRIFFQAVREDVLEAGGNLFSSRGGLSFQEFGPWHWLVCAGLGLAASAGHLAASGPRERRVAATRADELVAA